MRKALWVAFASILVLTIATARGQAPPTLIRVGVEADDGSTPIFWAKDAGLFARAGLNVDVQRLPRSSAATAAISDGAFEIARATTLALVVAHDRSEPFSIVAPADAYRSDHPDAALIVPAASRLSRGREFGGKALGVPALGDVATLATRAWLDADHAGPVQMLEVPPATVNAALDGGRIAGAPLGEPELALAVASGKYRVAAKVFDAIAPHFVRSAYFARNDWILANRDIVDRFLAVIREANAYVGVHESETPPGIAHPARPADVDPAEVQPIIALLVRYQVIAKAFPAQQMIYPSALPPRLR